MPETQNHATALVTGAALRLGRAIALDLAKRGWRLGGISDLGAKAESLKEIRPRLTAVRPADPQTRSHSFAVWFSLAPRNLDLQPVSSTTPRGSNGLIGYARVGWRQAELDVNLRAPRASFERENAARRVRLRDQHDRSASGAPTQFFSHHRQIALDGGADARGARHRASVSMRLAPDPCSHTRGKVRQISSASAAPRRLAAPPRLRRSAAPCAFCSTALRSPDR